MIDRRPGSQPTHRTKILYPQLQTRDLYRSYWMA